MRLHHALAATLVAAIILSIAPLAAQKPAPAPRFQVDPSWPKEMPNNWILGAVTGVFVDAKDHVWVTHLPETLTEEETSAVQKPPIGTCCAPAPTVDRVRRRRATSCRAGAIRRRTSPSIRATRTASSSITTTSSGSAPTCTTACRSSRATASIVMTIGTYDKTGGSNDTTLLGGPAGIWVDPKTNEVFIADGYRNRRVIVFDGATGKYLRHWGAYGEAPDDTQKPAERSGRRRTSSSRPCTASPARATA